MEKQELTFRIYCLKCPYTLKIKYIGVTSQELKDRLYKHIYEAKSIKRNKKDLKSHWIREILKKGKRPIICLIEFANIKNYAIKELLWQKRFEKELVNTKFSARGNGVVLKRTKESIDRSAASHYRQIVAFNNDKKPIFFESIKEATKTLNIPLTNIIEVLSKRCLSAYGYHFVYKENYSDDYMNSLKKINNKVDKFKILYNGSLYTTKELSEKIGCSSSFISMVLNGKRTFDKKSKYFKPNDVIKKIYNN